MRIHPVLALIVGITVASCDDAIDPSAPGTLVVSTATDGDDPDTDGYLLTIDGAESLALDPTGTTEAEVSPGRHTLRLLGVAEHCSVASATSLEVNVPPRGATSVAFEISCLVTGVRITTTTSGLDIDTDGFRIAVDGTDRGTVGSNDAVLTRMNPGSRTISLTALAPNCTLEGPSSRTVAVLDRQVASIDFEVVCTARTGVIKVVVEATGIDMERASIATVDTVMSLFVQPGNPAYFAPVPPGNHVVTLAPPSNCSIEDDQQPASVTAGELTRDTVEITFSVTCELNSATLRITAPTTGSIPAGRYSVWDCYDFYCYYAELLGQLAPNDTLHARVSAGSHSLLLYDVPARCDVSYPQTQFTLVPGDTLDVEFQVRCST